MPERSSKPKGGGPNQTAFRVMRRATEEDGSPVKNPAAVALGRLGGLKGGKARAEKLSAKKRADIAKRAALARWRKPDAG